jgi:carboxypeptidase family protein
VQRIAIVIVVWVAGFSTTAFGQAAIAGSVTDPSGARLPGVLVQATGSALIERTRSAITDGAGRYRIEDLRPGTYVVRFTLDGWTPVESVNVELTGSFTAAVDAELLLGPLTETITATAVVPAVDVHRANSELTLNGELVRSIPTARSYNALVVLVPGVVTAVNDTVTGTATTAFPIQGGRVSDGRLYLDGFNIGSPPSGNSAASYVVDIGNAQEVSFTTAGAVGEVETGGLVMNVVPKSGSNENRGSFFIGGTGSRLQFDNVTPALTAQGVTVPTPISKAYDATGTFGGPIRPDRAWMFVNGHLGGSTRDATNLYYNLNAGDASKWLYAPDFSRREYSDRTYENASARLTWQLTARHKITGFWDAQALCRTCTGATPGNSEPARVSPEAVGVLGRPFHVSQASWSAALTNQVLIEAGFGGTFFGVGNFERQPNPTRGLIRVAEQCASGCAANGNIPDLVYRSQDFSVAHAGSYLWKGALSRVTGTHSLKVGYQRTFMTDDRTWMTNDQNLTYRVDNGVPNQLTESISPWVNNTRVGWDAVFAQAQWTYARMTLQGAIRFDRARSWFPEQQEGPSRFLPTAIVVPATSGVDSYKDVTERFGAAVDVFGTGRTAVKVNVGKYLESAGSSGMYANANPTARVPRTTMDYGTAGVMRSWIDANHNFVPDCDLMNADAQDLRDRGGDLCGVISNSGFGKNVLTNSIDSAVLDGWGVRPSDWSLGLSFEQQIGPRSAVHVTYGRRWYHGFPVVDNLALQPDDSTPFDVVAPLDPRLPGGGGYVVSQLFDVVPAKFGQVANLVTDSSKYGTWYQYFNGLDVTVTARTRAGLSVAAGTSTGQTVADNCDVRAHLPELATTTTGTSAFGPGVTGSSVTPLSPYCHVAFGILTQLRGLSSYVVPKLNVQLSATFQSKPGAMLAANYAVPKSVVASSLGRELSGDNSSVTVNLVAPGTRYGDRINAFDLRVARHVKFGRARLVAALEMYNTLNSSAVLAYSTAFRPGGAWPQPLTIMTPRFLKVVFETDF